MKSEWKVSSNTINGEPYYTVYRLRDVNAVDHSGNREKVPVEVYDAFREVLDKELLGEQFLEAFANLLNVIHDYTEAEK